MHNVVSRAEYVTQSETRLEGHPGKRGRRRQRRLMSKSARTHKGPRSVACRGGATLALLVVAGSLLATPASADLTSRPASPYIVSDIGTPDAAAALSAVGSIGVSAVETLDAGDAVLANLTDLQAQTLGDIPGVVVTPDVTVSVQDTTSTPAPSRSPAAVFAQQTGATQLWAQGVTGAGVNIAVLDTGIDPLPDFAGRLIPGVDLSGEGNSLLDSYGHGTFVAGLIAGNGASSGGAYTGEAPGAGLVSVKVAGASGQTDLATVIEGVGWTILHRSSLNIGVLNMSLGYQPVLSTVLDPLDIAVQKAWQAGIVVVTSAGNAGPFNGTILSPGDDPLVITAGALDDQGQTNPTDDTMTDFSSVGPTNPDGWFKPDLVASGRSVISLRAPGSTIDTDYPSARIGNANFVGSGTSLGGERPSARRSRVVPLRSCSKPIQALLRTTLRPGCSAAPIPVPSATPSWTDSAL